MKSFRQVKHDGTVTWINELFQLHREGGPAVLRPDGTEEYWRCDRLHRTVGPAIVTRNGYTEFRIEGKPVSANQINKA